MALPIALTIDNWLLEPFNTYYYVIKDSTIVFHNKRQRNGQQITPHCWLLVEKHSVWVSHNIKTFTYLKRKYLTELEFKNLASVALFNRKMESELND